MQFLFLHSAHQTEVLHIFDHNFFSIMLGGRLLHCISRNKKCWSIVEIDRPAMPEVDMTPLTPARNIHDSEIYSHFKNNWVSFITLFILTLHRKPSLWVGVSCSSVETSERVRMSDNSGTNNEEVPKPADMKREVSWPSVLFFIHLQILGLYGVLVLFTQTKLITVAFSESAVF